MSATKVGTAADEAAAIREEIRVLNLRLAEIEASASAETNSDDDGWTFEETGEAEPASNSEAEPNIDGKAEPAIDFPPGIINMEQWGMSIIQHGRANTFKGRSYRSIAQSSAKRERSYVKWV